MSEIDYYSKRFSHGSFREVALSEGRLDDVTRELSALTPEQWQQLRKRIEAAYADMAALLLPERLSDTVDMAIVDHLIQELGYESEHESH